MRSSESARAFLTLVVAVLMAGFLMYVVFFMMPRLVPQAALGPPVPAELAGEVMAANSVLSRVV